MLCSEDVQQKPPYFLPCHGVIKKSSTANFRTVFGASCKSSSGIAPNDILLTGHKLQNNIFDLIFIWHNVVFCCDIHQILVNF